MLGTIGIFERIGQIYLRDTHGEHPTTLLGDVYNKEHGGLGPANGGVGNWLVGSDWEGRWVMVGGSDPQGDTDTNISLTVTASMLGLRKMST